MSYSRRDFLRTGAAAAVSGFIGYGSGPPAEAAPASLVNRPPRPLLDDPDVRQIAMTALDAAKAAGARYADVRVASGVARDTIMVDRQIGVMAIGGELQFGVRVLLDGAWGFASSSIVTQEEASRVAQLAVRQASLNPWGKSRRLDLAPTPVVADGQWETPIDEDPWKYTIQDQLGLQLEANEAIIKIGEAGRPGVTASSRFTFSRTDSVFASTDGSYIEQRFHGFGGWYNVRVVSDDRQYFHGMAPESFKTGGYGWEAIAGVPFAADAEQAVEDAFIMIGAKPVEVGRYDIVLDSAAVRGVFAPSIVRALEYDRVLGYEMHAGGTSYLSPPDETLGQFDYKNPKLNVRATGMVPRAGGAYEWDVEGVAPMDFDLIREGIVVDYFTTRQFAPELEWWYRRNDLPVRSRGSAGSGASILIQLVAPTIAILDPAEEEVTVEDMIAQTENGIFFSRGGGASMDPPLLNMQFMGGSGGMVYEIKDGKIGDPVKYAGFVARTPELWRSMDMLGGAGTFDYGGSAVFKGDPGQLIGRTVGTPAARFKEVNVINYGRRG